MGETSLIEWTDATWNPWQGCTKISPACDHCYMFRDMARYGRDGSVVVRSADNTFNLPLRKSREGQFKIASGKKVFTCSWSDWFHKVADPWRPEAWSITRQRRDLIFQIVSKRTHRIDSCLPDDWGDGYHNVWLIATAENQTWFNKRLWELSRVPAVVRGLSIEPLLGPIDMMPMIERSECQPDWVIVGGESGPASRPMQIEWVQSLRDQCVSLSIPFFFKQWGGTLQHMKTDPDQRLLDGREWNQFPAAAASPKTTLSAEDCGE
ncbi:MAG: DUF5131 family protein [Schlesneria sp.]